MKSNKIMISVIVPVYNVEMYVRECLESVLVQQSDDIELIIVDDGSTDNSYEICKEIVQNHNDKHLHLTHQMNSGLSEARNQGISIASGKYIMFLDSDDMLMENTFEILKSVINKYIDIDVVLFDALIRNEIGAEIPINRYSRKKSMYPELMSGKAYFQKYYCNLAIVSACLKMYKKTFLREKNIAFTKGKLHEDISHSFQSTWLAQQIIYIPIDLYCRRYRANSIMTEKKTRKHIDDQIYAFIECMIFIKKEKPATIEEKNSVCEYFINLSESIMQQCKIINLKMDEYMKFYSLLIDFLKCFGEEERGYTFYKALEKIWNTCLNVDPQLEISVKPLFCVLLGKADNLNILDIILMKLDYYRKQICENLLLSEKGKMVGIYGMGKHTDEMLECMKKNHNKIEFNYIFVDSNKESNVEKYKGIPVINIADASKYVETLILSSFVYHLEFLKEVKDRHLQDQIKIVDFYDKEKLPLF